MRVNVHFYSYFQDLTGCAVTAEELPPAASVGHLLARLAERFPRFGEMERCLLIAVGVDYQDRSYVLQEGDEVSFFPPVQGG
ncbi:MAG: MoaD/ThiS family protein [Verrucomicrobiales bacterium]|nr:MoaD/ThiS family protein [Verrucomicrobiales bacterium]